MANLGEQAITGERQHDHAERLHDGVDPALMCDGMLSSALNSIVDRLFVKGHINARIVLEAARRLNT